MASIVAAVGNNGECAVGIAPPSDPLGLQCVGDGRILLGVNLMCHKIRLKEVTVVDDEIKIEIALHCNNKRPLVPLWWTIPEALVSGMCVRAVFLPDIPASFPKTVKTQLSNIVNGITDGKSWRVPIFSI